MSKKVITARNYCLRWRVKQKKYCYIITGKNTVSHVVYVVSRNYYKELTTKIKNVVVKIQLKDCASSFKKHG
jgi:hypothetical protein